MGNIIIKIDTHINKKWKDKSVRLIFKETVNKQGLGS